MKKIFAALAASAVAVSMLAFAGCGDPEVDEGAIKGDYVEKTPEQVTEIVDKIDTDKIFGGDEETPANMNVGIKANLNGSYSLSGMGDTTFSLTMDYKEMVDATKGPIGVGTASVKVNSNPTGEEPKSVDLNGTLYNNNDWMYGEVKGSISDVSKEVSTALAAGMKAKINLMDLVEALENSDDDDVSNSISPTAYAEAADAFSVSQLLAMAQNFGVKVAIDDKDGVKIKLSVTEDTIWTAYSAYAAANGATEAQITEFTTAIKGKITFNAFKFDVYFAIDKDGKFAGASVVTDIDIKTDTSIMDIFRGEDKDVEIKPTAADATETATAMDITVTLKGSIELYTHSDTVEIPSTITTDANYVDYTQMLIAMIGSM